MSQFFLMALHNGKSITSIICRAFMALSLLIALSGSAQAVTLLRDADIEHALKQVATPILRAAGLNPNRVKVLVVEDGSLNAFVVSNDAIFLHSGLIGKLTHARQLQGVIAHEAAHIANGHITRRLTNLATTRRIAGLGMALAAAAAASTGNVDGAVGVAIGVSSSAQRSFLRHTRSEESSADQSAVRYMRAAGVNPTGLLEVLQIFRGQEVLSERRQDPYARSHPLSRDRMRALQAAASQADGRADDSAANYWFARAKGKVTAYVRGPKWTQRRAGESGYADIKAVRETIAYHRQAKSKRALRAINGAIKASPNDPFLQDLKGEVLMQSRDFSGAVAAHRRAAQLAPRDPLILSGYGRALLATGQTKQALGYLEKSRSIDYRDGHMMRDLATAYAKLGQNGMASLVTAERYALRGQLSTAGIHAKRASDLLATGSGPWQRAQDVLIASERYAKKRNR